MSLVAVATPGGLSEISSIALHLATLWPRPVTVIEADPDGGRLSVRHGGRLRPGLCSLVASLCGSHPTDKWNWATAYSPDVHVVPAPTAPEDVISAVGRLSSSDLELDRVIGTDVLISIGVIRPNTPCTALACEADARLLVMRSTIDDVAAVIHRRKTLETFGTWTVLTAGGNLTTVEVARNVHWPVLADLLPSDRRNSAILRQRIEEFATSISSNQGLVQNSGKR